MYIILRNVYKLYINLVYTIFAWNNVYSFSVIYINYVLKLSYTLYIIYIFTWDAKVNKPFLKQCFVLLVMTEKLNIKCLKVLRKERNYEENYNFVHINEAVLDSWWEAC